jgi:ABC-type branched-subunit amino acid transport system permease subunit
VSLRSWSGGSSGVSQFASSFYYHSPFDPQIRYGFGPFRFFGNQFWVIVIGWVILGLIVLGVAALVRAPWGRVVRAIREDEDAARSLGKSAYWYKVQSLMIGGVIGGIGGMVYAIGSQTAQPDVFSPPVTFFLYTILILGGLGRVWTPVVGAVIFWMVITFTDAFLRQAVPEGFLGLDRIMSGVQIGQVRFMLVGVGLMLLVVFRPQGLFGSKQEMALDD